MLPVIRALAWIEFKVFLRSRTALFWTFVNPIVMLVALMAVFGTNGQAMRMSADLHISPGTRSAHPALTDSIVRSLKASEMLDLRDVAAAPERRGAVGARLSIAPGGRVRLEHLHGQPMQFHLLRMAAEKAVADVNLRDSGVAAPFVLEARALDAGRAYSYGAYLAIGILTMTIVSVCLFGFSVPLVELRSSGSSRMYQVFPMSIAEFMSAYILSRLGIVVALGMVIVAFADLVYQLPFPLLDPGFWLSLVLLCLFSALAFICIGLMIAGLSGSVASANAFVNLLFMPLMMVSDIFLPLSLFPDGLEEVLRLGPLALFVNGARSVLIDGEPLWTQWPPLASLLAVALLCLVVARFTFRWRDP